jgi:hypothetical protein
MRGRYTPLFAIFKMCASDYDKDAPEARRFYSTLQDKFLYAICGKTACELVIGRADGDKPNMGLVSMKGEFPTIEDAKIGKNYLDADELYILHLLCEQFLLFAESKAMRKKPLTMRHLLDKLDDLLRINEYPIFSDYRGQYLREKAERHAREELELFKERVRRGEMEVTPHPTQVVPRSLPTFRRERPTL